MKKDTDFAFGMASRRASIQGLLDGEAERYRTLAEKEALRIILNPADVGPAKVREHLVRAETFKAAAAIRRAAAAAERGEL